MKASNTRDDKVFISHFFPFDGLGGCSRVVAIYHISTNTLEMTDGYAKLITKALKTLRKIQTERNIPKYPVKVEYW